MLQKLPTQWAESEKEDSWLVLCFAVNSQKKMYQKEIDSFKVSVQTEV